MKVQSLLLRLLPLPEPGHVLAEREWRTLVAVAEVLFPDMRNEVSPEVIADNVDRFLARGRSRRAWRIRALLHLVEWTAIVKTGKPFSRLSLAARRRVIEERYTDARLIWSVCAKIRYIALLGAYGDARMHAATSYVPVFARKRFLHIQRNGSAGIGMTV